MIRIVILLICGVICSKLTVTPFGFYMDNIRSGRNLVLVVFDSLKSGNQETVNNFFKLILYKGAPMRKEFIKLINEFSFERLLNLDEMLKDVERLNSSIVGQFIDAELIVPFRYAPQRKYMKYLIDSQVFPKFNIGLFESRPYLKKGLHFANWTEVVRLLGQSPKLISTKNICSALINKRMMGDNARDVWDLVDGEGIRGIRTEDQLHWFVRSAALPLKLTYSELDGLDGLMRMLRLVISVKYLAYTSLSTKSWIMPLEMITMQVRLTFKDLNVAIQLVSNPFKEDKELHCIYRDFWPSLRDQIKYPYSVHHENDFMLLVMNRLTAQPSSQQVNRAIIYALAYMTCSSTVDWNYIENIVYRLLSKQSESLILRRDLYILLNMCWRSMSPEALPVSKYIWDYLVKSETDAFVLLSLNKSNFSRLATLAMPKYRSTLDRVVRHDILKHLGPGDIGYFQLAVCPILNLNSARELTKENLQADLCLLLSQYFLRTIEGWYVPKIQLHPFIEQAFWQVLQFSVMFGIQPWFRMHPVYLNYLRCPHGTRSMFANSLVEVIVNSQFYDDLADPEIGQFNENKTDDLMELEKLQLIQPMFDNMLLGNGPEDYKLFKEMQFKEQMAIVANAWTSFQTLWDRFDCRDRITMLGKCVWTDRVHPIFFSFLLPL